MPRIATQVPVVHSRFLLLGNYGSGKTWLIGYMHKLLKSYGTRGIYLFDFDSGYNTLKTAGFDVEFDIYHDDDNRKPHAFVDFCKKLSSLEHDLEGYGGIAIDSLTSLQRALMNYIMQENNIPRQKYPRQNIPVKNDYGVFANTIDNFFPQFIQLNKLGAEVIMTAHLRERVTEKVVLDENNKPITVESTKYVPALKGRYLASSIGAEFNEIWRITVNKYGNKVTQMAQMRSDNTFDCKTQINGAGFSMNASEAVRLAFKVYGIDKHAGKSVEDANPKIEFSDKAKSIDEIITIKR